MTRLIGVMSVLGALTLAATIQPADAQTARAASGTAARLVGAWELVSRTVRKADGTIPVGYDPYFGRYTVDDRSGTVTHRVEGSLFPEDLGKDFVRPFTLDGDTLTLKFTSPAEGGDVTRTLVFRRVR